MAEEASEAARIMRTRLLSGALILLTFGETRGATREFLDRWLEFEQQARAVSGAPIETELVRQEISAAIHSLRGAYGVELRSARGAQALSNFIFNDLGIEASNDIADPGNLFLTSVLARRRGYCIGIAALYLAIAEQLDLPIFAVATPTHVFLRYDDGAPRINIEPFQRGAALSDAQYIREHRIPERSVEDGVFLRNLTVAEFLARAHNNLGVIYSTRKDFEQAAGEYDRSAALDPRFPAPLYNLGNDLLLQDRPRRAARLFTKALRLHPGDVWALNNRGLAYMNLGRFEQACRDFDSARQIDPAFEPARKNLDAAGSERCPARSGRP